jgi:FtsP/CotA-like multicopper oxidase with cupredoxin domain
MHGHHFHVLKIGYPPYNPVNGNATGRNPDIRCLNELCTEATWADPSWNSGYIPGVNLEDPPLKDTVSVPADGYVIIRLRADNPGIEKTSFSLL